MTQKKKFGITSFILSLFNLLISRFSKAPVCKFFAYFCINCISFQNFFNYKLFYAIHFFVVRLKGRLIMEISSKDLFNDINVVKHGLWFCIINSPILKLCGTMNETNCLLANKAKLGYLVFR